MNKNILLMNDSYPPLIDGVANTVMNYASILKKDGWNPLVATPAHPDADDSKFPYPVLRYPSIDTRKQLGYMAGMPFSPSLMAKVKENDISLVHTHCPIASTLVGRSVSEHLDVPMILTYHTKFDVDIRMALHNRLLTEGAIKAIVSNISSCDEVWAVSHGAGENLRMLGYEGEIVVMENGVDMAKGRLPEDEIRELTSDVYIPEGLPVFLFVGRMKWYKGIRTILDALAGLSYNGTDFRMVFAGSGADLDDIIDYAAASNIGDKCLFLGAVRDRKVLKAWYCRANLFLFPSDYDTYGLVVREAASCSTASVLLEGSCAAEGVTDGRNGFLINNNASTLAILLSRLAENPRLMEFAGQYAAEDLYISWDTAVQKAVERYAIVDDLYRSGKYNKKRRLSDSLFEFSGELMNMFAKMRLHRSKDDDE